MRRFLSFCLIVFALTACSSRHPVEPPTTSTRCAIDAGERLSWSDWRPDMDVSGTATFVYEGCGKTLVFVALDYTNDSESDSLAAVRAAAANQPDTILIDGLQAHHGENYIPTALYAAEVEGTTSDTEILLSVRLAKAANTPFRGANPRDTDIAKIVGEQGLGAVDLVGFYILRQLALMLRSGDIDALDDARTMDPIVGNFTLIFADMIGVEADVAAPLSTLAGFSAWYEAFNGEPFITDFDARDVYPSEGVAEPRPSNRAADIVADARDAFILDQIDTAQKTYDHVMIVYGGSHHSVQKPALDAAFGPAQIIR